jgi:hypothetical protein
VLITYELSVGAFSAFILITALSLLLYVSYHYFLALSNNHRRNHPYYFPMLLKSVAQKIKDEMEFFNEEF